MELSLDGLLVGALVVSALLFILVVLAVFSQARAFEAALRDTMRLDEYAAYKAGKKRGRS